MAYHSRADELLYGGAAGGGKSDLLLGLAGTAHQQSIIFRRVFPSLRGLIERSREIFNAGGRAHAQDSYNESLHIWRLSDGRTIELGSLQHDKDKRGYQGRPHDLKAWDELTEFLESQYRFVNAWNRSTRKGQRCRVVATSNPPTSTEGQWVIQYWGPWLDDQHTNPAKPGELRWYATIDGKDIEREDGASFEHKGETIKPKSRTFVPARLSDNPYLMEAGYESILQNLPEPLRSQLLLGNWKAGVKDDPWQVIPTDWVKAAMRRWHEQRPQGAMDALGVDVSRGGEDKFVMAPRYGNWVGPLQKHPGSSVPNGIIGAQLVVAALQPGARANVDLIGVGGSVYDQLVSLGVNAVAVNVAERTADMDRSHKLKFANVRAAMYWGLREALDPAYGDNLALPDDPELLADLCAPRWSIRVNGIQIESKDDIKARLNRSPDCGDAVALACYTGGSSWLIF